MVIKTFGIKMVILVLCLSIYGIGYSQTGSIQGVISNEEGPIEFAQIFIDQTTYGTVSDSLGQFELSNIPLGTYTVQTSFIGYESIQKQITLSAENLQVVLNFNMHSSMILDEIVVTGTKTFKRQTNSPIIVHVSNSEMLDNVQACNLSEGLRFQPGLRVETDCQTCNYTQLRMNGLGGGYSQILINGRPIFSPLTGLYGMEQLPVNMIDRIEVVRGGGSSLYGSNAIGGTVNVITKIPTSNSYEVNYNFQAINNQATKRNHYANVQKVP